MQTWIKWTKGLTRKREVLLLAQRMAIPPPHAAALCMLVWEWADDNTADGCLRGFTPGMISAAVGAPGIAEAMADPAVGWLLDTGDACIFANFDRHNGQCAKKRDLAARRKTRERDHRGAAA